MADPDHPRGHGEGQSAETRAWAGAFDGAFVEAANAARIGMSVVSMEPQPRVVYITDVGADIVGQSVATLLSLPAAAFLTPEEREVYAVAPERPAPAIGGRSFETTVVAADGRRVPLEISLADVVREGRRAVVVFFRDISQRRTATEALRRSEERFRRLIELAPDAIWINDGRALVYANPATVKLLGYDNVEQVLQLDPRQLVHPDDQLAMRERSSQMAASGDPMTPREYRVRRRDGAWLLTEVHSMPIEWEGHTGILGFARDVSARKQTEARLMRSDRLAALGTLLAGIAHEMNNPLTFALLGMEQAWAALDEIEIESESETTPAHARVQRLRQVLGDVRHGIDRVAAVVRQLRVSSRPDSERREPVDLRRVIESALRVAQNEIRHRAQLSVDLGEVGPVNGSAQQLEQVFLNVLVNATQALPEGRPGNQIRVVLRASAGDSPGRRPWWWPRSRTTEPAFPRRCCAGSSIRSSPPSRSAWAWGWDCRSVTASSPPTAEPSRWKVRRTRARRFVCVCRWPTRPRTLALAPRKPCRWRRPRRCPGAGACWW